MDIEDSRTVIDFQKFTFSGHLRSHVFKVLNENIKLGHADYTCYWILELMCSGLVHSCWNTLFLSAALHINRGAPQVFAYLSRMYERFAPVEQQYSVMTMTDIRNNSEARQILCEVGACLALTRKAKLPTLPVIKPAHDFLPGVIQENLKAPSSIYARTIMKQEDPMELYVPVNEFAYCLKPETRDPIRALYWVSWILKYAAKYKEDQKTYLICAHRSNDYVEEKYLRSPIWILWAVIHEHTKSHIDILFKMYCLRWGQGELKKRLPFLITAVLFICEPVLDTSLVPQNIGQVQDIVQNIPQWIEAIKQTKKTFA
jgi:hypothetical protein